MLPARTPPTNSTRCEATHAQDAAGATGHLIVLVVLASLLLSACGTTPDSSSSSTSSTTVAPSPTTSDPSGGQIEIPGLKAGDRTELTPATDPFDIPLPGVTTTALPTQPSTTVVNAPPTTAPGVSPTTAQPTQSTTTLAQPSPPSAFPTSMAAIRGSEQILLIDTTTGASAVIAEFSLVVDGENQIGPQFPFSVDVDAAAVVVRYDTCCDADTSNTFQLDLATGDVSSSVSGATPSVSPNGSALAVSHVSAISVIDTATGTTTLLERSAEQWFVGGTSWSRDGSMLAIEVHSPAIGRPAIAVVPSDASSLDAAVVLLPPLHASWTLPSFRSDGALVVVESAFVGDSKTRIVAVGSDGVVIDTIGLADIESILGIDHDVTGEWMLIVDGEGEAFWFGPGGAGRLPGSGYSSASW